MSNEFFSLRSNAFWVLKAGYGSSKEEIVELAEDAEFDELYPQDLIQRCQQALMSPVARLDQELGWLPGLSGQQLGEVQALLEQGLADELRKAINFFPDLPKANVLAYLNSLAPADASLLQSLLRCWDETDDRSLLDFINAQRRISGFPQVSLDQLQSAINALESAHARSAAVAVWKLDKPGQVMEEIVEAEIKTGRPNNFLARFVREYDSLSEPILAQIDDAIDRQIELARQTSSDLDDITNEIVDLLRRWDDVNQPVQVFEQYQGHEEGRSKKVYEKLRSLCIELANERGEFQYAKRVSEALLHTFPELESIAEVLKGDVATLGNLDEQKRQFSAMEPLVAACEAAKSQMHNLKAAWRNSGFAKTRQGILDDIFDAFDKAARVPSIGDTAFLVVRDLALFVNNDRNDPETAFRLIDRLIRYGHAHPSRGLSSKLEEERAVLHRNWKMAELEKQSGNLGAMSKIVDDMLKYAKGNDRSELLQLKSKIERKQAGKKIKWLIYAGIAAVIGFIVITDNMDSPASRTSYRPTTAYQPSTTRPSSPSPSPASFAESRPPVGQGLVLNRSQVRYCVFQGARLEAMRSMTTTNYQINRFNGLIDDYNARCSNFRYTSGVLSSVRREASSKSAEFAADARRIVASW